MEHLMHSWIFMYQRELPSTNTRHLVVLKSEEAVKVLNSGVVEKFFSPKTFFSS